jgi:hypothetical protein
MPFRSFIPRRVTPRMEWVDDHYIPRTTPSTIMAPSPIKPVESCKEEAALLAVVADDVGAPEVEVKVDDREVEVMVVVVGIGGKDKVGCPDARLQNCCPRDSITDTWLEQFCNTQKRIWFG